jgi:hypothetical protein
VRVLGSAHDQGTDNEGEKLKGLLAALSAAACALVLLAPVTAGAAECANEGLRLGPSAGLGECRAYEMVSPVDKDGGNVGRVLQTKVSPDGERVTFYSAAAFAGSPSSALSTGYIAKRGAAGWSTEALDPPQRNTGNSLLMSTVASTADLSASLSASDRATVPGAIEEGSNLYLRNNLTGTRSLLYARPGVRLFDQSTGLNGGLFYGATPDWSHIVVRSIEPLTADTPPSNYPYFYDLTGGEMHLLNVEPDGTLPTNSEPNLFGRDYIPYAPAISADGRYVPMQLGLDGVFIREDDRRTFPISVNEAGETEEAWLLFGNRDGTQIYFRAGTLRAGAPVGSLYRYDIASGTLTNLLPDAEGVAARVESVLGASPDGSIVYFTAGGALGDGATEAGFLENNLYALVNGELRFLGRIEQLPPYYQSSPDGRYLAFDTFADPTGGKTTSPNCKHLEGFQNPDGQCLDLYVYDATTGVLSCTACSVPDRGHTYLGGQQSRENSIAQGTEFARAVLDDGAVYMETPTKLVPRDGNGVMDVYSWQAGVPRLISTGIDPNPSWFGVAGADGRDVLFMTNQQLVGQDTDQNIDLYDARVDGGLASQWPSGSPPACVGEACKSPAPTPATRIGGGSSATGGELDCEAIGARAAAPRKEARRLTRQAKAVAKRRSHASGKRAGRLAGQAKQLRRRAAAERRAADRIQNQAKTCWGIN